MKQIRWIACLLVLAIGCCLLTACGDSDKPVTLTVYGSSYDVSCNYWKDAVELYEQQTGNTVEYVTDTEITAEVLTSEDAPDLMIGVGGEANLAGWDYAENLVDLSESAWLADVQEYLLPQTKTGNMTVGLPFGNIYAFGILYDKAIFKECGLKVPTNQTEFMAACSTLVANGYTPLYTPFADAWTVPFEAALDRAIQQDTSLIEKLNSGEVSYADIPAMTELMGWLQDMHDYGFFGTRYADNTYDGARSALSDPYAMALLPELFIPADFEVVFPEAGGTEYYGFFPLYVGDEALYPISELKLVMVNKNSDQQQAAREFLEFLARSETYNAAFDGVYTMPLFKQQEGNVVSEQFIENQESIFAHAASPYTATNIHGFDHDAGLEHILDMMAGRLSVEECLQEMDKD